MEVIKLGSIYFGRNPMPLGVDYNGEIFSIGDTAPGMELSFIKCKSGLLVSDRVICTNISWKQLDCIGFIFGQPIKIDGRSYLCRSLKVGATINHAHTEWDSILDEVGDGDDIWHWKDAFFWGQDTVEGWSAIRGYLSARYWNGNFAAGRNACVGFRPTLEPLFPISLISDSLVGSTLKIYGSAGSIIFGTLTEVTDYDLIINITQSELQNSDRYSQQTNGDVIIDRTSIMYFAKGNFPA